MRYKAFFLVVFSCLCTWFIAAQDVKRARPKGWNKIVFGGSFIDRFLPMPNGKVEKNVWGTRAVKHRFVDNGLEDDTWSYWGGNILKDSLGVYHAYICRWREDDPKGHWAWPKSEIVHAVANKSTGPYKVNQVIGVGHNPEIQKLKSGGYFLYASKFTKSPYYYATSLNGPWEKRLFTYDARQREIEDHMANNTFVQREDGSMLMVGRGGGVWLSKTGLPPYYKISEKSVYPPYNGKYEDPVVWKTNVQYHLIVNDWLGRIAYYMRSKDGINWQLDKGEAYLPGIAVHKDKKVEGWYKFERIKVLQDDYGRAYQANFAVADTIKKQDKGSDTHSSKNVCIPLTVGRLIKVLNDKKIDEKTTEIMLLIKAESGFNPHRDIRFKTLRFGASKEVDFGRGSKVIRKEKRGDDLLLVFDGKGNGLEENDFAAKLLGKTKKGELLYGFSRLPGVKYLEPLLSNKYPEFSINGNRLKVTLEIENFGQIASFKASELLLEYEKNGKWHSFKTLKIPVLKPYQKTQLKFYGSKIGERNEPINIRTTIKVNGKEKSVLTGLVVFR